VGTALDDPTAFIVGDPSSEAATGIPSDFVLFKGKSQSGLPAPLPRTKVDAEVADFLAGHPAATTLYESAHDFQVNGAAACSWATSTKTAQGVVIATNVYIAAGESLCSFSFWSLETRLPQNQATFDAILNSFSPAAADQ
jgi:hypothetical protein